MKFINLLVFKTILALVILSLSNACLKDDSAEKQADHDDLMESFKTEFGFTEANLLEEGIYYQINSTFGGEDTIKPVEGNAIVVDVVGFNDVNSVFDVTSYADAIKHDVEQADRVYGPVRLYISRLMEGLNKGIKTMTVGSKATFLLSHEKAFGGYVPIVYEVSLYRIIDDEPTYDENQFNEYRDSIGMDSTNLIDPESDYKGTYTKSILAGDSLPELAIGDTLTINLTAHYVETDTAYVDSIPGRSFFPINNSGKEVEFIYGEGNFPITEILHFSVGNMRIGEKWEILSPAEYAYGENGYVHPYTGIFIVPPGMAVHYQVEFVNRAAHSTDSDE